MLKNIKCKEKELHRNHCDSLMKRLSFIKISLIILLVLIISIADTGCSIVSFFDSDSQETEGEKTEESGGESQNNLLEESMLQGILKSVKETQETAEKEAAERAEREAQEAAERAEREAQEAAERAEREAQEAAERAEREAQEAAERAEQEAREAEELARKEAEEAERKAQEEAAAQAAKEAAEKEELEKKLDLVVFKTPTGKCYHVDGCRHVRRSTATEITIRDARAQGLKPCGDCIRGYYVIPSDL